MYNKTVVGFGFCDIQNNQGLGEGYRAGKGYQVKWKASADNPYLDLDYSGYHKNQNQYRIVLLYIVLKKTMTNALLKKKSMTPFFFLDCVKDGTHS